MSVIENNLVQKLGNRRAEYDYFKLHGFVNKWKVEGDAVQVQKLTENYKLNKKPNGEATGYSYSWVVKIGRYTNCQCPVVLELFALVILNRLYLLTEQYEQAIKELKATGFEDYVDAYLDEVTRQA